MIENASSASDSTATAGCFTVHADGSIVGPADFLATQSYRDAVSKIERGESAVVNFAPIGTPIAAAIAAALQTAYAAWVGQQSIARMGAR